MTIRPTLYRLLYRLALRAEWLIDWLDERSMFAADMAKLHAIRLQVHATEREREARQ